MKFPLSEIILVCIGVAVSCIFFYPGCLSGDSYVSWEDALTSPTPHFYNWHPPGIAYTWWLLNRLPLNLHPPFASIFLLMNLLFWTGLALAVRPWIERKFLWFVFFCAIGFFPPSFAILSQTLKDSLMCAALMAAYGMLLTAERERSRTALIKGIFLLFPAILFRHNAIFAVVPLALWAGFICLQDNPRSSWCRKMAAGVAIAVALSGSAYAANTFLTRHYSYPEQQLYTYDLVGISALTGHMYLPEFYNDYKKPSSLMFSQKGADLEESPLTIENIRKLYLPDTNMWIYFYGPGKALRFVDDPQEMHTLQSAWIKTILEQPATYLKVRSDLYLSLLGLKPSTVWPYYCMTSDDNDSARSMMTLPHFYKDIRLGWMFKPLFYIIVIATLLLFILWQKAFWRRDLVALAASGLFYTASYFPVSTSSDFRYLYWLMPIALIMMCHAIFTDISIFSLRWHRSSLERQDELEDRLWSLTGDHHNYDVDDDMGDGI